MDAILKTKLQPGESVTLANGTAGELQLPDGTLHPLRPLAELFGAGAGATSIDTGDEDHLRLLHAIEGAVVQHDHRRGPLSDGAVAIAMERLAVSPEGDPRGDEIFAALQLQLRAFLSLHDYSRQEVRLAARKLLKSIQRHTRSGGARSYLEFIHQHVPHEHPSDPAATP